MASNCFAPWYVVSYVLFFVRVDGVGSVVGRGVGGVGDGLSG